MPAKFPLGRLVITPGALETLSPETPMQALARHVTGDWGELDRHDKRENERALAAGSRLFSVYRDSKQTKFWIITEADRSATTILLPHEY